ncbi:MAG: hypothetical protein N7Q72_03565, partial [Spiroplasma sp. Tabriz.8]|nr:hypothetical protein [Spiroplasma sp. Tabriz.8]
IWSLVQKSLVSCASEICCTIILFCACFYLPNLIYIYIYIYIFHLRFQVILIILETFQPKLTKCIGYEIQR